MTGSRVVVYGDVIDDVVVIPSGPIRPDTDTASTIRGTAGGAAGNVAAWLAHLGESVDFVGSVGAADVERHRAVFDGAGIRSHLSADAHLPTGAIVLLIDGETRSMLTQRGANSALDPASVTDELLDAAALLYLSGYTVMDCRDPAALATLLERAAARGVEVAVDPASAGDITDLGARTVLERIAGATIVFPNLDEGRALTGLDDPAVIAAGLGERFDVVALTNGPHGAIVVQGGAAPVTVPAVSTHIVDPTGAGDAFAAGFLHAWARSPDAVAAANAGVAVAARAVQAIGGRPVG
ncbi:MAG: hypothetical protein RI885_1916 [Actinomycetota bacterium]|jgi:sugar/nucleoside kinase (ribokinase family)